MKSITPTRADFHALVKSNSTQFPIIVPVFAEFLADMETPVSVFKRIEKRSHAFLLESVAGGEQLARYSFVGADPAKIFRSRGTHWSVVEGGTVTEGTLSDGEDALTVVERLLSGSKYIETPGLPRFVGGAVGYIGYDWVRFLEPIGDSTTDDLQLDDVYLVFTDVLCIFDHVKHTIKVLANALVTDNEEIDIVYDKAVEQIAELVSVLKSPRPESTPSVSVLADAAWVSNMSRDEYRQMVEAGKEYIAAGDIIQTVLSQRFSRPLNTDPFSVYRALRSLNPSPYMFYLAFDGMTLVGASPEILVTDAQGKVVVRPIAGSRRRGATEAEDKRLEAELLADEKERAEHVMLVDLGRNDIGRVCEYGSVRVDSFMVVERYSHIMHIVSNVTGVRRAEFTPFDLLRATFPAGTLSGAQKVRAMQIIEELEPTRRGTYGGAIGYFSLNGNLDTAITIRTLLVKDGTAFVQAGGGIVADSQPDEEFMETVNKSGAVRQAIAMAEAGVD